MIRASLMKVVVLTVVSCGFGCQNLRAQAVEATRTKPQVWAVVVGIDRYDDQLIPGCTSAIRDARSMANWFARTAGWDRDHVLHLDERGPQQHGLPEQVTTSLRPTRENLDWAVTGWLGHRVRAGDLVVLYFAGQATVRPPITGAAAGRGYLLPIDAAAADVDGTGWSLEDALDRSGIAARAPVVLWLDTAPQGRGKAGLEVLARAPSASAWLNALTRWPGVTAWMAADRDRVPETRVPSAFVDALIGGLGEPSRAHNLVGCLESLRSNSALAEQGFLTSGGVDASLTLWPQGIRPVEVVVPELIIQKGHGDRITSLSVTADDRRLISASQDSTIRVWDLASHSLVRVLADPMNGVTAMALNQDGTTLVAGDGMGQLLGWDMSLDRPRSTLGPPEHSEGIVHLAFLPDGRKFVALDRSGRSTLWEATGGLLRKLRPFVASPLNKLATSTRPEPGAASLAASGEDGFVLIFDADGNLLRRLENPMSSVTALALSTDGLRVVVGEERGRVRGIEVASGKILQEQQFQDSVGLLTCGPGGRLLVGDGRSLHLGGLGQEDAPIALRDITGRPAPGEVERASFSADGRWLSACTSRDGRCLLWRLNGPNSAKPVELPGPKSPGTESIFGRDGQTLILGDGAGGVRTWTLDAGVNPSTAVVKDSIDPARGKVASLQVDQNADRILEITRDDQALIWEIKGRQGATPLPGRWLAGAFLASKNMVVLLAHPDQGGDVVLFDRVEKKPLPLRFARPDGGDGKPMQIAFGSLDVSRSGRWIAAASLASQRPIACVWEAETGKLVHWTQSHDGGLTAVVFSSDENSLLTASDDGTAKLWQLADPSFELKQPTLVLRNPDTDAPGIKTARICPSNPQRIVLGTRGGKVLLWDWKQVQVSRQAVVVAENQVEGAVNALTFSADGTWMAASGAREKTIRFWTLPVGGAPRAVAIRPLPHHQEQVGALAAWPTGSRIVSGGDDTAVRIWDLSNRTLVGTLLTSLRSDQGLDWLSYTPEGLFDSSQPGEALIKWRVGERLVTLEQSQDTHFSFGLTEALSQTDRPKPRQELVETPRLKFVAPPPERDRREREVNLTLWTGDRTLSDLRLYQNGIPVRSLSDFRVAPDRPNFATTSVSLRPGENRFYALASKPGTTDGRSDDLAVAFEGSEPPGRLHTLALGVSAYKYRALKYAHQDAKRMAEFLHERGITGERGLGEQIVLTDDQVTEARIRDAFLRLSAAVKGHPEDTVVVFLAGHTDTDQRTDQFCLLLPDFPFEESLGTPGRLDLAMQDRPGVSVRGNTASGSGTTRVGDPNVLAFVTIYSRLARLDSLQRLVIIDACQAGAILDDPGVKRIQRLVETGSRKLRNSYLLAARRGEPALEADALRQGLLTYVLLRGMGAKSFIPIPEDLGGFPGPLTADLNHDGVISTAELIAFTDTTLPKLTQIFPQVVARAGGPKVAETRSTASDINEASRLQSSDVAFPLIRITP